jgi:hypothetical protein
MHDHSVFIYRLEGISIPSPGMRNGAIDDGVARRVINTVFSHRLTADWARPKIGRAALFWTAWCVPVLNHAITLRRI